MITLPVAPIQAVRGYARGLLLKYPGELFLAVALYTFAAASGLVGPRLVGLTVDDLKRGVNRVDLVVAVIVAFVVLQGLLLRAALYATARLTEKLLAELREGFIENVLSLPLPLVERSGVGDVVARTTRDIEVLGQIVRDALPAALFAVPTLVITLVALTLLSPLMLLSCLAAFVCLWPATTWYLRRARDGYLKQGAAYSSLADVLTETVEGARTIEALALSEARTEKLERAIAAARATEWYTMRLRTIYLPISDVSYVLPLIGTLLLGGILYNRGAVTLAAVTAGALYAQQLATPIDALLYRFDKLQTASVSLARLLGLRASVSSERAAGEAGYNEIGKQVIAVESVSFAYQPGHDVLHEVSFEVEPGERVAIVGPSGAGKSTLGRLLAGVDSPRVGRVNLGEVSLVELPLLTLRKQVALVTQEHHVFRGSILDNLLLVRRDASQAEVEDALKAVDAWEWASEMGLQTDVGPGRAELSPAEAQQLSLARLVLADPRTLILDEATSMLDPKAARQLERSLAAVLRGRTVISIAHRLHTAHDAGRILLMNEGRIVEMGSHAELMDLGGAYASLWASWHGSETEPSAAGRSTSF